MSRGSAEHKYLPSYMRIDEPKVIATQNINEPQNILSTYSSPTNLDIEKRQQLQKMLRDQRNQGSKLAEKAPNKGISRQNSR